MNFMSNKADIIGKLKEAMRTSCDDALYFSDDETQLIDAEYLLTVNAAKAIKDLNRYFGDPYKICLEENTKKFATSCTPLFDKNAAKEGFRYKQKIRSRNDSKRSGKIDIAIYTTDNAWECPLCAIEVKGFNPRKNLIISDLERNAEYFGLTSPTGNSTLPFSVFIAMHSYKNVFTDVKEQGNIDKVKERYARYIESSPILKVLQYNIDVVTIRRGLPPDLDDPDVHRLGLHGDEDYHFVGVVVVFNQPMGSESLIRR